MKIINTRKQNKTLKFINNIIHEELSELNKYIYNEVMRINNNDAINGLTNSGHHYSQISNLIVKSTLDSLEKTLNRLFNKQRELNIKLRKNDIEYIRVEAIKRYQAVASNFFKSNDFFSNNQNDSLIGVNAQINIYFNGLMSNIQGNCNAIIENYSLEMKLYHPNESLKQAKIANKFSLLALLISVATLIYSVLNN